MPDPLLPLFPLDVVLLPGNPLPLHVFEDRYKEMVGEAIAAKTEFGIVQAGDKGLLNIGCTATVEHVIEKYEDGRMDLVVVGRRRFEIILLDDQKSWLRATVSFFDDEENEQAPKELRAVAMVGFNALQQAGDPDDRVMPDEQDPHLSFRIARFLPDSGFRQTLLALRSEKERLRHIVGYLPDYIAKLRRITHVRKVAPRNGHGMIRISEVENG